MATPPCHVLPNHSGCSSPLLFSHQSSRFSFPDRPSGTRILLLPAGLMISSWKTGVSLCRPLYNTENMLRIAFQVVGMTGHLNFILVEAELNLVGQPSYMFTSYPRQTAYLQTHNSRGKSRATNHLICLFFPTLGSLHLESATSPTLHLLVVSSGNLLFGGEPSREASLV